MNKDFNCKIKISISELLDELFVEIETDRLYIRSFCDQDYFNSLSLYSNDTITQYFDEGRPKTKEEIITFIENEGKKHFKNMKPFGLFSIFHKQSNAFIGHIDLFPSNKPGIVEIGYILHDQFHNKGYATEAAKALIFQYIRKFTEQGLNISHIMATVHPKNISSKKILGKLGMSFDTFLQKFNKPRLQYILNFQHSLYKAIPYALRDKVLSF